MKRIFVTAILLLAVTVAQAGSYATYGPVLRDAFVKYWPAAPMQYIPCGQVEQESGWNPTAHLHTSREDGYGLTQMTVTKRFNIFKSAVQMKPLRGWNWRQDPYNPKNQLTFLVLQDRSNWNNVRKWMRDDNEGWKATLVSYNAGLGRVMKRRTYAMAKGIPHDRWTGGLELAYTPGETALLYGRPLWKAVNEYPLLIFKKAEKYRSK